MVSDEVHHRAEMSMQRSTAAWSSSSCPRNCASQGVQEENSREGSCNLGVLWSCVLPLNSVGEGIVQRDFYKVSKVCAKISNSPLDLSSLSPGSFIRRGKLLHEGTSEHLQTCKIIESTQKHCKEFCKHFADLCASIN